MSNGEQPAVIVERDHRTEIGAFLLGALVGAGIALLFAPGSGEETQARLRTQARKLRELTGERVRGLREDLSARVDSAKGVIGQGRQIAAEAREELEDKLARSKAAYRAGLDAAREEFEAEAEEHG
ncbi:MAG: YtxH domain-containing protein [Gemmatimonadota bacterium]|nr:YtxH domain-containing protein [Gemmatimonadota bacterium]MDE2865929.1 YtxH domain-containing protein [Gemmatimonadota bacterium]MYB06046.1 YtxH domain-containing protein [Gemmatimonadota bacterium]MYE18096.1 YtxH domain-containing protein [Gemmatimonadota bacterium]MYG22298.1 YtxH domain-containing protein [Gemmatimonadota bacterium]